MSKSESPRDNTMSELVLKNSTNENLAARSFGSARPVSGYQYGEPPTELIDQLVKIYNGGDFSRVYELGLKLLQSYPNAFDILNILGVVSVNLGMLENARFFFQRAIVVEPNFVEAYTNIGNLLGDLGEYSTSIRYLRKAVSLDRTNSESHYNLGIALMQSGLLPDAFDAFAKAISLKPDYAEAHINLGKIHMLQLNFKRSFELMEWRWAVKERFIGHKLESIHPAWNGEEGTEVFVWKEQGVGDEIMFSSMLLEINQKSKNLIVECDKRLLPIYERSFPNDIKFIANRNQLSDSDFNKQIAIGSLPKYFRNELGDFAKASPGWLRADPHRTAALREMLRDSHSDKIIGISWFTNSPGTLAQKRNIPLEILAEFLKRAPAKYVSLQYGDKAEEILKVRNQNNFYISMVDEIDLYNDLDGLAALISACDTVISIDNLTAHLAGALGIDTRVLLPEVAEERWGLTSSDSYWYDQLTLYRQDGKNDWFGLLNRLTRELNIHSKSCI